MLIPIRRIFMTKVLICPYPDQDRCHHTSIPRYLILTILLDTLHHILHFRPLPIIFSKVQESSPLQMRKYLSKSHLQNHLRRK